MKIFLLIRGLEMWLRNGLTQSDRDPANDWYRDPLSHPALEAMELDELADLPFDPQAVHRQ
ncbi:MULTISPECIES: hypothetical protein [Phyllobacterium]|jgi:hypothetical protein|uniref:Uncharacterized protein n=1 Tax=Phyllobacterium sophorae TaxID=1520277 RepID=A0A2P7BBS9_9HYPH|nr:MULTISPECIES: hypothetical protein [Phyllobacterium]PSH63916.1 hypothetical protein CU103_12725 [Phyllobacterium sophorae]UXN63258.1 hypothetical protein N8E89_11470 [Phyllobacterium sp. A18/5-2]